MNLVLAHGYLGFREFLGIEYFHGVKQLLEASFDVRVLVTKVDPDQGIETRGEQLRRQILVALGELSPNADDERRIVKSLDPARQTHILGHSMGGLDSRFILSPAHPNNIASFIASLTTISTPHRGSPIADWFAAKLLRKGFSLLDWWMERKLRPALTKLGISLNGLQDLTTKHAASFNDKYVDHPQVRYFSVAGAGRTSGRATAKVLYPGYEYMKKKLQAENDGLVTVASATWGEFDAHLWPAHHLDEIGHDLDHPGKPGRFDHLTRFRELVARLQKLVASRSEIA
jgi:triacylglycerol lipase